MGSHGMIVPAFWDDLDLASRSIPARLVAAFLLTGREATHIPGLLNLGIGGLAEAMRIPYEQAHAALTELRAAGFIQVDVRARLIRVPNAPRYNARGITPNGVRVWFRGWTAMPSSTLKDEHVASVRSALVHAEGAPWFAATWLETFGTVAASCPHGGPTMPPRSLDRGDTDPDTVRDLSPLPDPEEQAPRQQPLKLVVQEAPHDPDPPVVTLDDLEGVYREYPRKEGKKRGLSIARSQVKTVGALEDLRRAVHAYAAKMQAEGRELDRVKHFDTFMGCWRDYLDPEVAAPVARASPRRRTAADHLAIADALDGGGGRLMS